MQEIVGESGSALVAEDEAATRSILCATLKSVGYVTAAAATGEECLDLYRRSRPDFLFLDINLPQISGLDVLRTIRGKFGDRKTPIIMVSAHGDRERIDQAKTLGATYFIVKPFTPGAFLFSFETWLAKRKAAAGAGGRGAGRHLAL